MKKIALGSALFAVALLIGGCSSTPSSPAPEPIQQGQSLQQPVPAPAYEPPVETDEDRFMSVIGPEFPGVPRSTAVNLGRAICTALDEGLSFLQVGQVGVDNGFTPEQAGTLVGASIGAFCPEYIDAAQRFANS